MIDFRCHIATLRKLLTGFASCVVLFSGALAAPAVDSERTPGDDSAHLAQRIDESITAAWQANNVQPTVPADDAEYLRRTYLNLVGRVPRVSDVLDFLDDESPQKRRDIVEQLLASPGYAMNFTDFWRSMMIPEASSDRQVQFLLPNFENWLHKQLTEEVAYDEIVSQLIAAPLATNGQVFQQSNSESGGLIAFYRAKQFKPENLASATSRLFLGIRLECAQCHDHPFADWRRDEFWRFAAFFSGISGDTNGQFSDDSTNNELTIPDTEQVVKASFPIGESKAVPDGELPRRALAAWLTGSENDQFARSTVNRIWAHFFGIGLVEPVDDFDPSNPPSHPELLDELARQFVEHDHDIKFLIRAITASKTYQLSSRQTHESQADERLFARRVVRPMAAEQLFESLRVATGYYENPQQRVRSFNRGRSPRTMIESVFTAETADASERRTSILQALELMNGAFVAGQMNLKQGGTLAAVIDAPFYDTGEQIEILYLSALGRRPSENERTQFVEYVESAKAAGDAVVDATDGKVVDNHPSPMEDDRTDVKALSDIYWAILNSGEFLSNH